VGIGMPVYNGERFLPQAVESLLAQTFGDFELVISDNASTDGTEEICRRFVVLDPRVRYERSPVNLGGPANFRRSFALCRGEYHKWATADDFWAPTMLERCVSVLDRHPDVVLCYPKTRLVDAGGNLIRVYEDDLHLMEDSPSARFIRLLDTIELCQAHLGVIRRAAMARTGLIGAELASDTRFLAELTLYGKFFVVPEYLFSRRWHEASSSWARTDLERQRAYYDPARLTRFGFHTWRRLWHLFRAVARAPIPSRDKRVLYRYLGRQVRWARTALWKELAATLFSTRHASWPGPDR
jgi:glycosyltransferase involved in cell wall biosynthesis